MARKPRVHDANVTQHVIQRGCNRNVCFFNEADYQFYLDGLKIASEKMTCEVHAYVLMSNHVHLLVTPRKEGALAGFMKLIGQRYTQYVNYRYERTGSMWEGRYKSSVIDTDLYLLTCYRYIELNPVRAGMTQRPSEYRWSSARWHGLGERDEIVRDHELYNKLGVTEAERQAHYRALFRYDVNLKPAI